MTDYPVHVTRRTPEGLAVADPYRQLDDVVLDGLTDRVETCLAGLPAPTPADLAAMDCLGRTLPRALDRSGWTVLVAPDWRWSTCAPGQQVFPCRVDPALCDAEHLAAKGLPYCPGQPCSCRATVQGETVVVTPNLLVYAGELLRLVTACNLTWTAPLAPCAGTYPR